MNISPPSIYFQGDKTTAMSLRSKAMSFYYFIANQVKLGGVDTVTKSTSINGNTIIACANRDKVYNSFINGYVKIITVKTKIVSEKKVKPFITYNDSLTTPAFTSQFYYTEQDPVNHAWERYREGKLEKLPNDTPWGLKGTNSVLGKTRYWYNDKLAVNTNGSEFFINGSWYKITNTVEFPQNSSLMRPGCCLKDKNTLMTFWWGRQFSNYTDPRGLTLEVYKLIPGGLSTDNKGTLELISSSRYNIVHENQYDVHDWVFSAFDKDVTYLVWVDRFYDSVEEKYYYEYYKVTWEYDKDANTYTLNAPQKIYSVLEEEEINLPTETIVYTTSNEPGTYTVTGNIQGVNGYLTPAQRVFGTWTTTYTFSNSQTEIQSMTSSWNKKLHRPLGEYWLEDDKLYWICRKINYSSFHSAQRVITESGNYTRVTTISDDPDDNGLQNLVVEDISQETSYSKTYSIIGTPKEDLTHGFYIASLDIKTQDYNEDLVYELTDTTRINLTLPEISYNWSFSSHREGWSNPADAEDTSYSSTGDFISVEFYVPPSTTMPDPYPPVPEDYFGPVNLASEDFSGTFNVDHGGSVLNLPLNPETSGWSPTGTTVFTFHGREGINPVYDPIIQLLAYDYKTKSIIAAIKKISKTVTLRRNDAPSVPENNSEEYSIKLLKDGAAIDLVSPVTTTYTTSQYILNPYAPTINTYLLDQSSDGVFGIYTGLYKALRNKTETGTATHFSFHLGIRDPAAWDSGPAKGYWFAEVDEEFLIRCSKKMGARAYGNTFVNYPAITLMVNRSGGGLKLLTSDSNPSGILDTVDMYAPITVNYKDPYQI